MYQLRQQTGCTRASAVNTFDLQQVSDGVHGCVQVSGPNIRRFWSVNQWRILSWGASDSKAACHALNLCRVLYLPTKQYVPSHQDREKITHESTDTCVSFHFTRPLATAAQIRTAWIQNMGRNGAACLASSWCRWTETALDRCLAWFQNVIDDAGSVNVSVRVSV